MPKNENHIKNHTHLMASMASKYTKLDHREHVLKRPNMYIGSTEADSFTTWVFDEEAHGVVKKEISYIPGLYKIFDEIIVNAIDHSTRMRMSADPDKNVVKNIKVSIDKESGWIEVFNDGDGIDVVKHPEHSMWIPELIFGNLLTSINYDDNEEKIIGGQNGLGAKLTAIFSKTFVVETVDAKTKKLYTQTFSDNMTNASEPVIKSCSKKPYTKIKFLPDFKRFGVTGIEDDMYALMVKRVYDTCALTDSSVNVFYNGTKLEYKSMERYVDMYIGDKATCTRVYEKVNDKWEVVVAFSDNQDSSQVSFVNGICTLRGGKHMEYITNQVTKKLIDLATAKKKKDTVIKPQHIRDSLSVFVKATIVNPTFDSQSKETLTTPISKFGSKGELSDKFIEKLYKTGVVEKAILMGQTADTKNLKKTDGKKKSVIRNLVKLEDANWAGTARSKECTLILTEGDSAQTMVMSGIEEVGRDRYGVFPLKGKLLNVKDCNPKRILENEEITNLKKIIGLETGKEYSDTSSLRYGKILALTDSDVDGSHIKGLLFNLFQSLWPSLFKMDGFLNCMLTPIIKAKKGSMSEEFFNLTDYEKWKSSNASSHTWDIKYYKGLGTSTANEARDYFKKLKTVTYTYTDEEDITNKSMDLAFNKKLADARKEWLARYDKNLINDHNLGNIPYEDFVNKELIHFSLYDVERSIPSLCDGLKISQRKIIYCCFKKKWSKETRVAQLSSFVSENSAYHHGEESLNHAIVGLAQDFVGSNNINLLMPNGQFGSRLKGGKDSASPRYIYTELAPITRAIYRKHDDDIVRYLEDDGVAIEPAFYAPVIPMVLVNGAMGIGTGFSTSIPSFNPLDIIRCLKGMLKGEHVSFDLVPWYRGFRGSITNVNGKYYSRGSFERIDGTSVRIKELPVGTSIEEFKEHLESLLDKNTCLKSYDCYYNDVNADFVLHFASASELDALLVCEGTNEFQKFENEFKLVSTKGLSMTNMYLLDQDNKIRKYDNIEAIVRHFFEVRESYYIARKDHQLNALEEEKTVVQAKIVFINEIIEGTLNVFNVPKKELEHELDTKSYPMHNASYDYLVGMPIYNLTRERKEKLEHDLNNIMMEIRKLTNTPCEDIWLAELDEVEMVYRDSCEAYNKRFDKTTGVAAAGKPKRKKPKTTKA
jgi:DNA topoisomerase-2